MEDKKIEIREVLKKLEEKPEAIILFLYLLHQPNYLTGIAKHFWNNVMYRYNRRKKIIKQEGYTFGTIKKEKSIVTEERKRETDWVRYMPQNIRFGKLTRDSGSALNKLGKELVELGLLTEIKIWNELYDEQDKNRVIGYKPNYDSLLQLRGTPYYYDGIAKDYEKYFSTLKDYNPSKKLFFPKLLDKVMLELSKESVYKLDYDGDELNRHLNFLHIILHNHNVDIKINSPDKDFQDYFNGSNDFLRFFTLFKKFDLYSIFLYLDLIIEQFKKKYCSESKAPRLITKDSFKTIKYTYLKDFKITEFSLKQKKELTGQEITKLFKNQFFSSINLLCDNLKDYEKK